MNAKLKTINSSMAETIIELIENKESLMTEIPGLELFQKTSLTKPINALYEPSVCLTVQGSKIVFMENEKFRYDSNHYLITSVQLPAMYQVIEASKKRPCLGLVFRFDLKEVTELIISGNLPSPRGRQLDRGMAIGEMTIPLLTAFQRYI